MDATPPAFAVELPTHMPLEVARLTERCDQGENAACLDAAAMFLDPHAAPDRPAVAARLLDSACKRTSQAACAELGWLCAQGLGVLYDPDRARSLMEQACRAGDPHGCARLGEALVFARYLPQDLSRGMAALQKACDEADVHGCASLARMSYEDMGGRVDESAARSAGRKALELGTESCEAGHYNECKALFAFPGWGRPARVACRVLQARCRAGGDCSLSRLDRPSLEKLCRRGRESACIELAHNYGHPLGTGQGYQWLKSACLAGIARGCWALEHWSSRPERYEVLAEACRQGELGACAGFARDEQQPATASDVDRRSWREFACSAHSALHCRLLLVEREREMNRTAFVRAMEDICRVVRYRVGGRDMDAQACDMVARAYYDGDGVPRDPARALALFRRACFPESAPRYSGRVLSACISMAEMFDAGDGVDQDRAMATALLAGACHAGEPKACTAMAQRVQDGIGIAANAEAATRIRTKTAGVFVEGAP